MNELVFLLDIFFNCGFNNTSQAMLGTFPKAFSLVFYGASDGLT